ncbi:MAG: ABC transporter ATP-binding protein [Clostridiales bacterium]|jgi:NitT/TauT family transport system ATP-binding protein|nr:ABC transporter ATP-binding protein [Clostridiales bacterium]
MDDILTIENVGLTYQSAAHETEALRDISLRVKEGEFVAIVGPSGCGKTTVLSLAAGLLKPTAGSIRLGGKEITGTSGEVGYMLQSDNLFAWRTILQNVTLGLEVQKKNTPENIEYAKQLLQKYGLGDFIKAHPRQLSGGMRQRAALIRTLAFRPKLLLLDEPFSALDFQTRLSVCDDVYAIIREEKKTALLVTHDISEAVSLADRIVVLSARPATVKRIYTLDIDRPTPLKRREDPAFSGWFDKVWKEVGA